MSFIVESSVRAVLVAGGVAAVVHGLRIANARARHSAWCGVLLAMLLLPALCAWGPKATLRVLPRRDDARAGIAWTPIDTPGLSVKPSISGRLNAAPAPVQAMPDLLWTMYLLVTGLLVIRLVHGATRAASIPRRARPEAGFFSSPECACPISLGWWRPVVVLPSTWTEWPEAELDAVLQHERGHVRHRDPLVQWLAALNRCIFWFHPLAWWLEHKLSAVAEEACDAAVIASGHDPRDYSEYLIHQARAVERAGARIALSGAAIGGGVLSHRIRQLIDGSPAPALSRSRAILGTTFCILATTAFTACQLGRAEEPAVGQPAVQELAQLSADSNRKSALLVSGMAAGQNAPKLEFEVASVKTTAIDPGQLSQLSKSGQLKLGPQIHGNRADYIHMSLRQLVAEAYQVRPFQIDCPDWFLTGRFDVFAKMPAGSRKDDAPLMLQSLLADRFKLAVHRESREEAISALVVGQGGPNLRESPSGAPLNSGHSEGEPPERAGQATVRKKDGSSISGMMGTVAVSFTVDPANSSVHLEASRMTMADLAHFLMRYDLGNGRPVVDMTGLKGNYEIVLDIPMSRIGGLTPATEASVSSANAQAPRPAEAAPDPGSGRMMRSIKSLGLDLNKMKAPVEHLVVDHAERKPTEN